MASRELFYAYKETRVNLEPTSPATVVHARVPTINGSGHGGRRITGRGGDAKDGYYGSRSAGSPNGSDTTDEERSYRIKTLATEAAIFHRRHHDAPRSFLWRVLERGDVLSLRAIDIAKTSPDPAALDAPLTLSLHFPKPIRLGCVAFADPPQHDALIVFVLDESFHLHHLQLRPDVFRKRVVANETDLGEAWKPYMSATFNFKQPRRLVAISANEFVVALSDGGLINFRRDHAHEGSPWKESFHSPVSFVQGLRSILPFQGGPTIKYEGTNLEITAAASAVVSSMGLDDVTYLFSVCLDHRLRIWNIEHGEICYTGDLLGLARDPHELGKWIVDPSQTNLIRILDLGEGVSVIATYSPVGAGAFKFWKVTAIAGGGVNVEPFEGADEPLQPSLPTSSDVWTLADFAVSTNRDRRRLSLWVLWKNNLIYRVMTLECAPELLASAWGDGWLCVHTESSGGAPTAQTSGPCDPTDAAEKWLDLIFFPGRFSRATLETALAMYERGLGATKEKTTAGSGNDGNTAIGSSSGKSLIELICSVLGSTASLERNSSGAMDYELFRSASEIQWRRFYRLLVELDKQRGEALSLVLDSDLGLAWIVCTDCVAAVRECSALERIYHNSPTRMNNNPNNEKVARLLTAGTTFLDSFSDGMLQTCEAALRSEVFDDSNNDDGGTSSSKSNEERIQALFDKAGFWRHLTDDECAQVADILGGEYFPDVDAASYDTLFALLEDVQHSYNHGHEDVSFPLTQFGQKLVLRGAQDTAELVWQILFRQLILLVHMEFEVDDEKQVLHARLDVGQVYSRLIAALKRLELVKWLARNEFSVALSKSERESLSGSFSGSFSASGSFSGSPSSSRRLGGIGNGDESPTQIVTVLEASVGHLLGFGELSDNDVPLAALLTDILVDLCSAGGTIELDPSMIQCMLLKRERPDLALKLGAFAHNDPFSTYVQGRTFLALRDYDIAALYFRKAAVGLSANLRNPVRHSAGLIDDAEWNLFYSGFPNYHAHIVGLYDRQKAYSFVIEFARLSLQFVRGALSSNAISNGTNNTAATSAVSGSRSGNGDEAESAAVALVTTRTEMLSRLFTAATALSRFEEAHSALISMGQPVPTAQGAPPTGGNTALQRSGLRYLVEKMCETGQVAALIALPFPANFCDAVDDILDHKCRAAVEVVRNTVPPWHQILYSWRVAHNNYRGAASVLLDRLQKLQQAGEGDKFLASNGAAGAELRGDDVLDTPVTRQYLMLINTLSCVEPKQAWIYTEDPTAGADSGAKGTTGWGVGSQDAAIPSVETDDGAPETANASQQSQSAKPSSSSSAMASFLQKAAAARRQPWRKVVTLADLRKQYQAELDRIAAIQNNQFAFGAEGDDEDITMDDS